MSHIGTKFILAQRFVFDPNNNSLVDQENDNETIRLGSNESRILLMLSEKPNQVISRDQLHEFVWRDQGFQVDDSSLTQAISTLRKMLGDSTKSPQFVKTVPKRGYQLIASVTRTNALSSDDSKTADESEVVSEAHEQTSPAKNQQTPQPVLVSPKATAKPSLSRRQESLMVKILLLIAVLLPLFVYVSTEPAVSRFKLIDTVDSIPIMTTENHPPLDSWKDLVKTCIQVYVQSHPGERTPVEVIVTAGPRDNIILNAVHSEELANENMTIQLIANQQGLAKLCN